MILRIYSQFQNNLEARLVLKAKHNFVIGYIKSIFRYTLVTSFVSKCFSLTRQLCNIDRLHYI